MSAFLFYTEMLNAEGDDQQNKVTQASPSLAGYIGGGVGGGAVLLVLVILLILFLLRR